MCYSRLEFSTFGKHLIQYEHKTHFSFTAPDDCAFNKRFPEPAIVRKLYYR